jgi:hypothetical protein
MMMMKLGLVQEWCATVYRYILYSGLVCTARHGVGLEAMPTVRQKR